MIRYVRLKKKNKKKTDFWQVKTRVPVQDETFSNMCTFMFQFPGGTDNYLTISGSSHPFLSSSSEVGFAVRTHIWSHWENSSFKRDHVASAGVAFADQWSASAFEKIDGP